MDNDIKRLINKTSTHKLDKNAQSVQQRVIKKPINRISHPVRNIVRNIDMPRNKNIARFAPNANSTRPQTAQSRSTVVRNDIKPPQRHPLAAKADVIRNIAQRAPEKPAKEIKEEAIAAALNKPVKKEKKVSFIKRHFKLTIATAVLLFVIIISIAAYMLMPSFSVKIASFQAGINATYPEWHPDGYGLSGPVTYDNNEVIINFKANTGKTKFNITQEKSLWDSTAVKENFNKKSKGEFMTTEERGLTIYSYNGNAQWVNGGILYSINGDAPLSSDQIRRIANSF